MTELKALLARMKAQMREWDEVEHRDDWWQYQRDFAAAHAHLSDQPSPDEGAEDRHPGYAPCPTCRQYSHSLGDDALAKALMHFEAMTAHPVRGHPMGHIYDDATRDAAQVLMAAARLTTPPADDSLGRLREALREAESVLALVEKPSIPDPDYSDEIRSLGDAIGYGALMSGASAIWREKIDEDGCAGGEFVAGPCQATVASTLANIRNALTLSTKGAGSKS